MKNHKVDAKTKLTIMAQPTINKWIVFKNFNIVQIFSIKKVSTSLLSKPIPKGMLNILDSWLLRAHLHLNFFVHANFFNIAFDSNRSWSSPCLTPTQ